MNIKHAYYTVLAMPQELTNINDAKAYELTFTEEMTPQSILMEANLATDDQIESVHQASYTPGAFGWAVKDKSGSLYYILQKQK